MSEKDSLYFVLKTDDSFSHFLDKVRSAGGIVGLPAAWAMRWTESVEDE